MCLPYNSRSVPDTTKGVDTFRANVVDVNIKNYDFPFRNQNHVIQYEKCKQH